MHLCKLPLVAGAAVAEEVRISVLKTVTLGPGKHFQLFTQKRASFSDCGLWLV